MLFWRKRETGEAPAETGVRVDVESSVCTGETLIGVRGEDGRLRDAVVVRSRRDAEDFCKAHGTALTEELLGRIPPKCRR